MLDPRRRRLAGALLLLALAAGAAVALAALPRDPAAAEAGRHEVRVEGPEGPIFRGTVLARPATALGALLAAAEAGGFAVETEEFPGMGAYVRAVAGHRAAGAAGWLYETGQEGAWTLGDRSAARAPLAPGDAVRWRWTSDGT